MSVYKTEDLLIQLSSLIRDGYQYVEISELEADDEYPASLSFEVVDDSCGSFYGEIDSCESPDDFHFDSKKYTVCGDSVCGSILFTYDEIFTIHHAVNNALEFF